MTRSCPKFPSIGVLAFAPVLALPVVAQGTSASTSEPVPFDITAAVERGCEVLVGMQEEVVAGAGQREWPYEGVYRTTEHERRRVIPIGYRVGGTAICALALIESPGYLDHGDRRTAVERGLDFILDSRGESYLQPSTENRYDVRGWGHIYALKFLLRLQDLERVPERAAPDVEAMIQWLIAALEEQAIPKLGGWSYAGRRAPSPFMTAPALQALFHATARGHAVDAEVIERALDALERGRARSGSIAYSTPAVSRAETAEDALGFMDKLPGAIARMSAVESTLLLGGRGDQQGLRSAVDAFFEHWEQLELRRQKTGTHERPYGVAPYYFMYGHYYVAQAIELISDDEVRSAQRGRLAAVLAKVQEEKGGWNDRVFARSRNYGTAMGLMAILMPRLPAPSEWVRGDK